MPIRTIMAAWLLLTLALATEAGTPQFDGLIQLLDTKRIGTVDGLVGALPADLRSYYTLAFSSRSLQGASYANPRAILFGRDANFVVTFNGESSERGYSAVETMEFDPTTNGFVFREIAFASSGDPAQRTISPPNPARCAACHGTPARPIWDVPPSWPGIYGERYRAGLSPAETRGIKTFLELQPTHPRYRHLISASHLAARETYVPEARATYNGEAFEAPNERLSALLTSLNVRSIVGELAAQPGYAAHRYALLAAVGGHCGVPASFYPDRLADEIQRSYAAFVRRTARQDGQVEQAKLARRVSQEKVVRRIGDAEGYRMLRFETELSLGVSTRHWTLALEDGANDFSAPESALTLDEALFGMVAAGDSALRDLATYRDFSGDDRYCEHLRRESRRLLSVWYAGHSLGATAFGQSPDASTASSPRLLERCVSCHSSDIAPRIPFADPAAMTAALGQGHYPRGRLLDEILYRLAAEAGAERMPRGVIPNAAQQAELETYFLSLASSRPTEAKPVTDTP